MDIWNRISGIITAELTSAAPETALSAISSKGIDLFQMEMIRDLTWSLSFSRRDLELLQEVCRKRGDSLKIIRQAGLYYILSSLLRRQVLIFGITMLLVFSLLLPGKILFVRVEGNETVPSRKILAAAEEAGILFGTSRRSVRSEKVKNRLLSAIPELQWAGINTSGCVATISVREQSLSEEESSLSEVTSIVALRDGYILSATATEGNLLVQPGQTVKAGQVLISGYTDCGLSIQATRSSGDIFAQTRRYHTSITPSRWAYRLDEKGTTRKISLLWRKKRINLWKGSGNVRPVCDRMYEEYYVTLPGGFSLPFGLCVETFTDYDAVPLELDARQAQETLSSFNREYLTANMVAGQILDQKDSFFQDEGIYGLKGTYICSEMIGREQQEQIGDHNGKNS